jgi:predicted nucleotidyltransferase
MDNKLNIINHLGKNWGKKFTMNELSKLLKIPYASFYRTIQEMKDLIIMETVGKAKTIKINTENKVIKSYLSIASEEEKKEYLKKQPIIKKITDDTETEDIILLFGSYAKKEHTEKSDIDIMIINKDGKKSISFYKFELLFKKEINPLTVTKKEFQQMLKEKEENVGKQALKNHIILKNPEKFWENVLNAV